MHCSALADLLGKRATLPGGCASHTPGRAPLSACINYVSDSGWGDPTPFGICFIFFFLMPLGPHGAQVLILPDSVLHTGKRAGGSQGQERAAQVDLRLCLRGTPHTPQPLTLNSSLCCRPPAQVCRSPPSRTPPPPASVLSTGGSQGGKLATSTMGAAASQEGAVQTLKTPDQPLKEIHMPPAAPGADAGSVCGFHACAGNRHGDPLCRPLLGGVPHPLEVHLRALRLPSLDGPPSSCLSAFNLGLGLLQL